MMAPLSVPSVYAIRIALEEIEGAIRDDPSPEDAAAGRDLGMPVLHLGGEEFDRVGRLIPWDADGAASEQPEVIFEVPPKVTDAEVFEALGEGSGEVARQVQIKGTDAFEEALANAYMLRGLRHPGGALRDSKGSYEALRVFCALQPPGYRDGPRYAKSRRDYDDGCRVLSANFERAPPKTIDDWEIPRAAFDTRIFYPNPIQIDWRRCPVLVYDRLGILKTLGIGVDFFETITGVVESESFLRELSKLGQRMMRLWERRKADLARSVSLNSLGFERWAPGGVDCYSVRLDGNYRAHLRVERSKGSWIAEAIGDHKSMGHG